MGRAGDGSGEPMVGFQRQKLHIVASFPFLALWASSSSLPWRPSSKRKWSVAFGAEAEDEAQDSWIVKSLSGLRIRLKKQQVLVVLPEHHVVFNRMLGKDPSPSAPRPPVL